VVILVPMLFIGMGIGGSASGTEMAAEPQWEGIQAEPGHQNNDSDRAKHIPQDLVPLRWKFILID
jgi:hypothetical protein